MEKISKFYQEIENDGQNVTMFSELRSLHNCDDIQGWLYAYIHSASYVHRFVSLAVVEFNKEYAFQDTGWEIATIQFLTKLPMLSFCLNKLDCYLSNFRSWKGNPYIHWHLSDCWFPPCPSVPSLLSGGGFLPHWLLIIWTAAGVLPPLSVHLCSGKRDHPKMGGRIFKGLYFYDYLKSLTKFCLPIQRWDGDRIPINKR